MVLSASNAAVYLEYNLPNTESLLGEHLYLLYSERVHKSRAPHRRIDEVGPR